jgi:hypothetical protein
MFSQNLRVTGPHPADGENPAGEAVARSLSDKLSSAGFFATAPDDWRDCGWVVRCRVECRTVDVVVSWISGTTEWFFQISADNEPDDAARQPCTAVARTVAEALRELAGFELFRWKVDGDPADGICTDRPQLPVPAIGAPIRFPALAVSEADSFGVVSEVPSSGSAKAVRPGGYFHRLAFFDCAGLLWPVIAVHVAGNGFLSRLLNRTVPVQLFVGDPEPDRLAPVVGSVCTLIDNDPDDLYCEFVDHAELKAQIRAARTPQELIRVAQHLGRAPR